VGICCAAKDLQDRDFRVPTSSIGIREFDGPPRRNCSSPLTKEK